MSKVNTAVISNNKKNIDKNLTMSETEKKYGTGETMTKSMTFYILKYIIIGIMSILGLTLIAGLVMSIKGDIEFTALLEPIKICINLFAGIIMALIGYFIGRKTDSN